MLHLFNRALLVCGLTFLLLLKASAEDIELNNGMLLKDAKIVGESPESVYIEHSGKIETYPISDVPKKYLQSTTEWKEPIPSEKVEAAADSKTETTDYVAIDFDVDEVVPERDGATVDATPSSKIKFQPRSIAECWNAYVVINQALAEQFVALTQNYSQVVILLGLAAVALLIAIVSIVTALFYGLFTWITHIPERSYWRNYKLVFTSAFLSLLSLSMLAIIVPEFIVQPHVFQVVPAAIGLLTSCYIYSENFIRSAICYFIVSALLLGLSLLQFCIEVV